MRTREIDHGHASRVTHNNTGHRWGVLEYATAALAATASLTQSVTGSRHARSSVGVQSALSLPDASPGDASARARRLTEKNFALHPIFGEGVVLTTPTATIHGQGAAGERVDVSIDDQAAHTHSLVDAQGRWSATLTNLTAGGPYTLDARASRNISVSSVFLGQVFLFTGASNMHHPLFDLAYERRWGDYEPGWRRLAEDEILRGPNRLVRSYIAHKTASAAPLQAHSHFDGWQVARPENKELGAIPYLFAARLQPRERVPVGIIQAVAGGTSSQEWLSHEKNSARNFHNGMLAPLHGFNFTAVVISQGESEVEYDATMKRYHGRLGEWFAELRAHAGYPNLPVIVVGTAGLNKKQAVPVEAPEGPACGDPFNMREAQIAAVKNDPHATYVVTSDIGDSRTVHYPNKWDVARRCIEAHRHLVKHDGYTYRSPMLANWEVAGSEIVVGFAPRTQPIAPGRKLGCGGPVREVPYARVQGLAITNASYQWEWANATLDNDGRLHVFSPQVPNPVAARYAWARNPLGNLYTFPDGAPMAPWRTDNLSLLADGRDSDAPCSFVSHRASGFAREGGDLCPSAAE